MTAIFEQFRPQTWEQVIGQDKAVRACKALAARGFGGRCIAFVGPSGVGKTSAARLLAAELADPMNVVEVDSQWLTPARIADLEADLSMFGLGAKSGRVIIVNEIHALSASAVRQLLTTLERIPSHCCWIFTTTRAGQELLIEGCDDASPLLSRCLVIELAQRGLAEAFAGMVRANMASIGMDGKPVEWYVRLAKECRNNARMMYERAEYAALAGE